MRRTRALSLFVVAGIAAATITGVSSPASASVAVKPVAQASVTSTNKLVVTQNPTTGAITINQGSVLQAGQVIKVEMTSLFPDADLEILQLHGVIMEQVDTQIALAGQGGATAQAAMRWFTGSWDVTPNVPAKTTFYGGLPFAGTNKFDLVLAPGTYYVTQLRPSGNVKPSTVDKAFTVVGSPGVTQTIANQRVTVTNTNGPDNFSAYNVNLPAVQGQPPRLRNGQITLMNRTGSVTNRTRELHFFQFRSVPVGTTPAQACASNAPGGQSFGTMSTQRAANAYLNVPLGWYWVTSWIPDVNSGTPHAFECDGVLVQVVAGGAPYIPGSAPTVRAKSQFRLAA